MSSIHYLNPSKESLHGFFSREMEAALTIDQGDTVIFKTLDASWGMEPRKAPGEARVKFTDISPERKPSGFGHSLVGPVFIKGAEPGRVLEVRINEIVPDGYGWTSAGGFPSYWNKKLGFDQEEELTLDFKLDSTLMVGESLFGNFPYSVKLNPFMGIMGVAPAEKGEHSTLKPSYWGGNLDCKELRAGSTLYLPISVEGGLFSTGDGHAVQGDGEVSGPALECGMERVSLTFNINENLNIKRPIAKTNEGWLTMAFHEDLEEAMWLALSDMLDFMASLYGISRVEAYALATMAVDLRVTQIVNVRKGVHAFLPFGAVR
ncbi:acetamidase/formamidase family protein [Peribacillus kribbensis]|uniref:acetamidase/formamidase family protein n=1 Tax=Peribacillus kribbensis TaxID=356658 RepID=UPI0003F9BA92|nr:acetamidase/formamidase family protein [Peribacillus kribbensis]